MNLHWHSETFCYAWGPHQPTLRLPSGSAVAVACPDADNGLADGSDLPRHRRQVPSSATFLEANPLAGPIYVEGVTERDSLAVELQAIELTRDYGLTLLAPDHGLLSRTEALGMQPAAGESIPRHLYRWRIDVPNGLAEVANPLGCDQLRIPLQPTLGCLGVCPPRGQVESSLCAGVYGGNLDLPLLRPGATIWLPVYEPGGLLMLGDIHAAQGPGEIVGGGIETSGVVYIAVRRIPNRPTPAPRLLVDGKLFAVATASDLRTAVSTAYARLLDWLAADLGLNRWDAYQLVSQAGHFELGGIAIAPHVTAAAGLPVDLLPDHSRQELKQWQSSAGE
ncbi:MAG: acetamidase/formamidase family protein [Pirellulales bacterium]|nr:acetamidase/formamidase family protein [Pirellulales bacterium]